MSVDLEAAATRGQASGASGWAATALDATAPPLGRPRWWRSPIVNPSAAWQRYSMAGIAIAVSLGLAILVRGAADVTAYSIIVFGVVVATWYGGLRVGLGGVALVAAVSTFAIAEPRMEFALTGPSALHLAIGMAMSAGAAVVIDALYHLERRSSALATDRDALLRAMSASESRLAAMADALPVLISYIDAEERYQFNNRSYETWFGHDRRELHGRTLEEVLGTEAYAAIRPYAAAALRGEEVTFEAEVPYRDAGVRWVHAAYTPDVAPDGRVRGFFALVTDITANKRAEEVVRRSEERGRLAESAARFGTFEWDMGETVTWSESMEAVYGFAPGGYPGTFDAFLERVHPDDRQMTVDLINAAVEQRRDLDFEHRIVLPDGSVRWLNGRGRISTDATGKPVRLIGIGMDITERRLAAEDARDREDRELALAEITTQMVTSLDAREVLVQLAQLSVPVLADICSIGLFNRGPATERLETAGVAEAERPYVARIHLRGWRARPDNPETIGERIDSGRAVYAPDFSRAWIEACAPDDEQRSAAIGVAARSLICVPLIAGGSTIGMATFAMTRSGRTYSEADLGVIRELAGRASIAVHNAVLVDDLTETAESLQRANAAKDEFLGLVSHELKTPITTIMGNAEILERRGSQLDDEMRAAALGDIRHEAERLHRIIDNLLVLARLDSGQQVETEPVIVSQLVERVAEHHRRGDAVRDVVVRLDADAKLANASPDYVEQVLRNLVGNAAKYSRAGAPIEITTERHGGEISIRVLDAGDGIPDDELEHIFTPFYRSPRTAQKVAGVGIGLAVCKRLVEAQEGRIWACRRKDAAGTEFGFTLPVVADD